MANPDYIYSILVRVTPNYDAVVGKPYYWEVQKLDKNTKVKTTHGSDYASSPEQAFVAAQKKVLLCLGESTAKANLKTVYQPVYELVNGMTYVSDVFMSYEDALKHAEQVDCVPTGDNVVNVLNKSIQTRHLVMRLR